MFSFYSQSPLPVSGAETYQGMAFDGCQYYLTAQRTCAVAVLDGDFRLVKTLPTRRTYMALCYDPKRTCFWALSGESRFTLFKLDCAFQETDCFDPRPQGRCPKPLTGVSFCCESGHLLVSSSNLLLEVDPDCQETNLFQELPGFTLLLSVICLPPYLVFTALRSRTGYFVLADRSGRVLEEERSQEALDAAALVLDPCACDLLLLTNKRGCYPHLLRARLEQELLDGLCPCNRDLCAKCGGHCRKPCDTPCKCEPCEKPCRPCKEPCPPCGDPCCKCECRCTCKPCCPSECPCPCADILSSIALMEAATAHILNAEGEKLQKVIAGSADPGQLLKVNESVQRTILYVTQLEQLLLSKLEALQTICLPCKPEKEGTCPAPGNVI